MSFQTRRIREEKPLRTFPWRAIPRILLLLGSPFVYWYKAWKRRRKDRQDDETVSRRVLLLKRIATILLSVFLALVLLAGVTKALVALKILNLRTFLSVTATDLPRDENGLTNVLLLGKGDDDHDGVDLTDTIMIASFDPRKTKSAVLLSIPRDLYVTETEKMGRGRVNELYRDYKSYLRKKEGKNAEEASKEAMRELMREIGSKLGIRLHAAVMVNFSGFVQAVDALGGIDVVVPYDIADSEYPGPDYTYQTFAIKAGDAHLDGETALKYARSRHTTSDFGRSARQQQIIQALADKARGSGVMGSPSKILALLRILSQNVETTLSSSELLGFAKMGQELDRTRLISMQLNDRNGLYGAVAEAGGFLYAPPRADFNGASVLLPVTVPPTVTTIYGGPPDDVVWSQIRSLVSLLLPMRSIHLSHPRIAILNAGGKSGLASRLSAELTRYGFSVENVDNATLPDKTKLDSSFLLGQTDADKPAATFFSTLLHLPLADTPAPLDPTQFEQVTIVLGKDYAYSPLVELLPKK